MTPTYYLTLALKLYKMRSSVEMTQRALAYASGVGEKTISSFENGSRTEAIRLEHLLKLTEACGMSVAEFLEWEIDAEPIEEWEPATFSSYPTLQSSLNPNRFLEVGG
jgi:transcriptional regulator with XRE-family HTH domain